MKICISAESTIDLPREILDEFSIKTIPFSVILGSESGFDGDITPQKIFDYVDKTGVLPRTSAINEVQYEDYFTNLLKEYDAVIHFALSSEISSACNNAFNVAQNLKGVYVVDSRSLSTGIGLLAINAAKLAKAGKSVEEILENTKKRIVNDDGTESIEYEENEIDLIIEENGVLYPIEIKKKTNSKADDASAFTVLDKDIDKKRGTGAIICTGKYKLKLRDNLYSLPIEYL